MSERRACRVLGRPGSARRRVAAAPGDGPALVSRMVGLAARPGRSGCRRVAALLRAEGPRADRERVERPPGPGHANPARGYDFVECRTSGGRAVRLPTVIGEHTRECPAIGAARRITAADVLHRLCDLFAGRDPPAHVRPDSGPGSAAKAVRGWLGRVGVRAPLFGPGRPRGDGSVESSGGKLGGEPLNLGIFGTPLEARVLVGRRRDYSAAHPHSAPDYRPPAPEARLAHLPRPDPANGRPEADD